MNRTAIVLLAIALFIAAAAVAIRQSDARDGTASRDERLAPGAHPPDRKQSPRAASSLGTPAEQLRALLDAEPSSAHKFERIEALARRLADD